MVIRELLIIGTEKLSESKYSDAIYESRLILSFLLNVDMSYVFSYPDREVEESVAERFLEIVNRREEGYPLQYILGTAEFMGREFAVRENVLIPRSDTEILVSRILDEVGDETVDVLEIGVGSGIISLSLGCELQNANVLGVDINPDAIELAEENKERLKVSNVEFRHSDLFQNVDSKFHIIVSNPPYIPSEDIGGLQVEVAEHEPRLALDGGADGLDFYRAIIQGAPKYLHENGRIYFEIGYNQGREIEELLRESGFTNIEVISDYSGHDRVVRGEL